MGWFDIISSLPKRSVFYSGDKYTVGGAYLKIYYFSNRIGCVLGALAKTKLYAIYNIVFL